MTNDINGLKSLISPTATMDVEASNAKPVIRAIVENTLPKLKMEGWADIDQYFKAEQAKPGDKASRASDFKYSGDTCRVTFVLRRGPFQMVTVLTAATLVFKSDQIQHISLSIS